MNEKNFNFNFYDKSYIAEAFCIKFSKTILTDRQDSKFAFIEDKTEKKIRNSSNEHNYNIAESQLNSYTEICSKKIDSLSEFKFSTDEKVLSVYFDLFN